MAPHAGEVELIEVTTDGHVELRFGAMCSGCPYRPLTMSRTIRPALLAVPGISSVSASGSRISEEAERRLAEALASGPLVTLRNRVV
jgi:Fe-S cluster biogenesis protein NfuA